MPRSIIIDKKPGAIVPAEYFAKALEACPTSLGFIASVDGEIFQQSWHSKPDEKGEAVDISEAPAQVQDEFKDHRVLFVLGSDVENFDPDWVQPFGVLEKDDKTILSVLCAGEFPEFKDDKGTNEFTMCGDLAERINKVYSQAGNDLNKTLTLLDTPTFRKEIQGAFLQSPGLIVLFNNIGDPVFYENKANRVDFEWGSATEGFGMAKASVPAVSKKPSLISARKPTASEPPPVTTPPPATEPAKPAEAPNKEEILKNLLEKDSRFLMQAGVLHLRPPKELVNGEGKRGWFRAHFGIRYDEKATLPASLPAGMLQPNSPLRTLMEHGPSHKKQDAPQPPKTETSAAALATAANMVTPPIISPEQILLFKKRKLEGFLQLSPKEVEEAKGKFPKASEQLAKAETTLRDVLLMPFAELKKYSNETLAIICLELAGMVRQDRPHLIAEPAKAEEPAASKKPSLIKRAVM